MSRQSSGIWAVDVVTAGKYRFELRRYPREAEKAIGAMRAAVKVGDRSAESELTVNQDHAVIELELKVGHYDMETTFSDGKNNWGAYFVYVSMAEGGAGE